VFPSRPSRPRGEMATKSSSAGCEPDSMLGAGRGHQQRRRLLIHEHRARQSTNAALRWPGSRPWGRVRPGGDSFARRALPERSLHQKTFVPQRALSFSGLRVSTSASRPRPGSVRRFRMNGRFPAPCQSPLRLEVFDRFLLRTRAASRVGMTPSGHNVAFRHAGTPLHPLDVAVPASP